MLTRIVSIAAKEFIHIRRDKRTLAVIFLIPIVQLILLGYTATTDIDHLRTAVLDMDRTQTSRELITAYQTSNYFDIVAYVADEEELARMLDKGDIRAGILIPPGYGRDVVAGERGQVAFVIDGSDPNVASTVFAASQQVAQAHTLKIIEETRGIKFEDMPGIDVYPRVWYNPDMSSTNFMIPALMGTILFFLTIMLTSMAIVRERERGTIEQIIVTPIRPLELILGKVIPYTVVASFNVLEVLLIGVLWFKLPIHGNVGLLLGLSGLFLITSLGLGLFISSVAQTQQEAMMWAMFLMLPSIFLSGFFFPLEAMPPVLQAISYLVPLRYYLIIVRGIILKGIGLDILLPQAAMVATFGIVILTLASKRFKKTLD